MTLEEAQTMASSMKISLAKFKFKDGKYYYLTELAAECSAKRLVPDYISAKKMKELKSGDVYPCMGCRSFLHADPINHKYYGKFNQGRQLCPSIA